MAGSFFNRHLVWWSSRESIAAEKISLLAVAEVIFSVAAYWWIAWYFDTYAHLLISILVAPLVLLRSDESVALGVEMFSRYLRAPEYPLRSTIGVSFVVVFTLAAAGASWLAADWFLVGHVGWPLFWRSILIGLFGLNVAVAGAGAVTIPAAETMAIKVDIVVAIAVAGAVAVAVAGGGVEAVAVAGVAVGAVGVVGTVVGPITAPGFALGFLFRSLATRLFASLRHIHRGAATFPKNWRRILFQVDLVCSPELVPKLGAKHPNLDFGSWVDELRSGAGKLNKTFLVIVLPILFIPSLLYRYSIKSTCWLYLPLIYLAHLPEDLRDDEKREAWLKGHTRKVQNWASLLGAVVALLAAVLAYTDYKALTDLVGAVQRGNLQATPLAYLLVLDFSELPIWHWFSLPAAGLTFGLFFAVNSLAVDLQTGAKDDVSGLRVRALIWLSRLRNLLVFCWVVITVYYFADYAYGRCPADDWMAPLLEWHFGPPPTCPAPGD